MVISILTLLSSTILFALWGAQNDAKEARTRSVIKKIDALMQQRWESYRAKTLRRPNSAMSPNLLAAWRIAALRELMRIELPDRIEDVVLPRVTGITDSPLRLAYASQASGGWTAEHQGSECLYLILSNMRDGDVSGLEFLGESEIGDTDGDGMREVLDGWGNPIEFLRWARGFLATWATDLNGDTVFSPRSPGHPVVTFQTTLRSDPDDADGDGLDDDGVLDTPVAAPDPFDPLRLDATIIAYDPVTGTAVAGVNRARTRPHWTTPTCSTRSFTQRGAMASRALRLRFPTVRASMSHFPLRSTETTPTCDSIRFPGLR